MLNTRILPLVFPIGLFDMSYLPPSSSNRRGFIKSASWRSGTMMAEQRSISRTRFVVDLGDLELPPIIERQIEYEIRAIVLKALTNPELGAVRRLNPSVFGIFPGRTLVRQ
jgi:hypothetical protein